MADPETYTYASNRNSSIAPVYRYFTADLLTNQILAEIPLRGVSFECAIKAAGKFSGKIPITAETDSMDLYDSTMPGQTALYVVRDGKCVWGGIIWSRSYELSSKDLSISASEFTSYFYHRKIWKTWNHQYGCTVSYNSTDGWTVVYDYGSNVVAAGGSTVKLEFYEPENFQYNGYYRVADVPAPTDSGFSMVGGFSVSDIYAKEVKSGWTYYYTKEPHGYVTGDAITISLASVDGVPNSGGPAVSNALVNVTDDSGTIFRVAYSGSSSYVQQQVIVEGTAAKTLPTGTYNEVTVTVRLDTYDYIRSLIDAMFNDFVGEDFPNVYIEPGLSYTYDVISRQAYSGSAILQTSTPHNLAPGQAIQVQDVGKVFDGEYEITGTPSPTTLVYRRGGNVSLDSISPKVSTITQVQMVSGVAQITTSSAHGMLRGQHVTVALGNAYDTFTGTWVITAVPSSTTLQYDTGSTTNVESSPLPNAQATVGATSNSVTRSQVSSNTVTMEVLDPITFSVGNSVTVAGTDRFLTIAEKSFDAPNSKATIKTTADHGLSVGDSVTISGLSDTSDIITRTNTTTSVTMTTKKPHNFKKGNVLTIQGLDLHKITNKVLTSNVATITTQNPHNASVGTVVTISDLYDKVGVSSRKTKDGTATITTSSSHNFSVNDQVTIAGLTDTYSVVSKQADKAVATLTLSGPHNILVGQKMAVSGLGGPYDSTSVEVTDVTATRVMYKLDMAYWDAKVKARNKAIADAEAYNKKIKIAANAASRKAGKTIKPKGLKTVPAKLVYLVDMPGTKAAGTLTTVDSFYNGSYAITAVTSNTFQYFSGGEDQASKSATGANISVTGPSVMNGTYTLTAVTASTLSYAKTANNSASAAVALAKNSGDVQPLVSFTTVHDGAGRTVTAVTSNTFTFSQSMPTAATVTSALYATRSSLFNGTKTITAVPTSDRFTFAMTAPSSVLETTANNLAVVRATGLYNGTFTITSIDNIANTFSYSKTLKDYGSNAIQSRGKATVRPMLIISTFGPFPGNANMGMKYSSQGYTGVNIEPTAYRGFELKSVGEALDAYADNIDGFEYRIDSDYDVANGFTKTFTLIPINFPDPPGPGEVAPLSRYGADALVFEYPGGNITEVSIEESAEDSATRFFATGATDLGADVGPNIGVASSNDLLRGVSTGGRMWPLLDATESVDGVDDKDVLYANAQRYLSEGAPPSTTLNVSLNGSIAPFVGEYKPGDWCSLVLNDPFIKMRLASNLEPRNDVIVRKIDSYRVTVPDGVTYPETVELSLVAEWEVDTRG